MTPDARDEAVVRLEYARAEEDRLGDIYRGALGTPSEFHAYHRLQEASAEVAFLEARLELIDHDGLIGRLRANGLGLTQTVSAFRGHQQHI